MLPRSGRDGYMEWNDLEMPIYSWIYNSSNLRTRYYRAQSLNLPVRNNGPRIETLSIRGVQYFPEFIFDSTFVNVLSFNLGWNDFVADAKRFVPIQAMIDQYVIDILYHSSSLPSFMWTMNLSGCGFDTQFQTESLLTPDRFTCPSPACTRYVQTSDSQLNGGIVKHVRSATITRLIERSKYFKAQSNNHYAHTKGVNDQLVDLVIEGDFDYWIEKYSSNVENDYKFYVESGTFFSAANMRVIDVGNFVVNIQTAEIISAIVRLGASY